jgi:hypothetical protein
MGWATRLAIFSQYHPVTMSISLANSLGKSPIKHSKGRFSLGA